MTDSKQTLSVADRMRSLVGNQTSLLIIVMVVLSAIFTAFSNGTFLQTGVFANILTDWGSLILLAVGQTLVVISGGIDLSVGSTVSLSTVVSGYVLVKVFNLQAVLTGNQPWGSASWGWLALAALVAVLTGLVVGAINALLINVFKIVPFIATLSTFGAAAGFAIIISGGMPLQGPNDFALMNPIKFGDIDLTFGLLSPMVIIMILITAIVGMFLHKARFGLYTYSLGSNAFATRAAGINVARHTAKIYLLSGALSGFGGFFAYVRLGGGSPSAGMGMELFAIAATVIGGASLMGGIGRIWGTVLGTLILYTVQSGLLMVGVSADWKQIVVALLIAAAVAVQTLQKKNGAR
jgi:ribose transport system permease protein